MTKVTSERLTLIPTTQEPPRHPIKLGPPRAEALDTMLRIERSPPPMPSSVRRGETMTAIPSPPSPEKRVATAKMQLTLAHLIMRYETLDKDDLHDEAAGGFEEVYRFLQHTEHLRILLQE